MTEQRRIRRFVLGLNVEIQKDLAVAQINAFSDAVEKALRVENARFQVRNFQAKKRAIPENSLGQGDKSTPPKFGRGTGGVLISGMSRGAPQPHREARPLLPVVPAGTVGSRITRRTFAGRK